MHGAKQWLLLPLSASAVDASLGGDVRKAFRRGEVVTALVMVAAYAGGLAGYLAGIPALVVGAALLVAAAMLYLIWAMAGLRTQAGVLDDQAQRLQEAVGVVRLLENELRHQGMHDRLTGLPNRVLLDDRLEHALRGAARADGAVAVLICDLDGFKHINESLGHRAGDKLLAVVAKRLASVVRTGDTVARMGGDEFAIVMADIDEPGVALNVAERIVSAVRRPIYVSEAPITATVSVGLALAGVGTSAEVLLSESDAAMYAAKSRGKDRVVCFEEPMRTSIVRRMALRNGFADALHGGEFYLQYQPHMSLPDRRLLGFEALARWRHPNYGEIEPDEFIPLAEETGFIIPLGRWILETACLAGASWQHSAVGTLTMSVNVSTRQLANNHFFDDMQAALSYTALEPTALILEATESILMVDPEGSARVLHRAKELGVRIAIDDFGTGYSSLGYLSQLPVDVIKIDKSFVDPLGEPSGRGHALVSAILRLAEQLQLATIVEGIETEAQLQTLVRLGYTIGQGELLSPPLDRDAAAALVRAQANGVDRASGLR